MAASEGFQQATLKTALDTIPRLSEDNYGVWKDKMDTILDVRGCPKALTNEVSTLDGDVNNEIKLLIIS